ncbi:MAG TPA: SGNH/GDSL hydrolase family protein, partial [Verrucomicrobiota bacterium]|nr:SGNH/GDSL hydrolase family protein [Verrucomicrobiota bacterium]
MKSFCLVFVACAISVAGQAIGQAPKPSLKPSPRKAQMLNFIDGDQVLLIGDGLIEQAQKQGYLEYRIMAQNSGKKLYFHNIGWSGDTPAGIARDGLGTRQAGHEPANEGWLQLRKQITVIKPTVAIIGYGMASSLDGSTMEQFRSDYQRLVEHIKVSAGKKNPLRLVFVSPIAHEDVGGKLPSGEAHNKALEEYREVIGDLSKEHEAWFVDLYWHLKRRKGAATPLLTTDGIHLNDYGYWVMASAAELSFNWMETNFRFGIMDNGTERGGGYGIKLANILRTANEVTLDGQFDGLPPYFAREKKSKLFTRQTAIGRIQFLGLPEGLYTLAADDVEIYTGDAKEWSGGA